MPILKKNSVIIGSIICLLIIAACNSSRTIQKSEIQGIDEAFLQDFERTKDLSTNTLPRERLLLAINRQNEIFASQGLNRAVPGIAWEERGPNNIGGRIRAVLVDKNDPSNKKVWVGGVGGGIWYTNDITAVNPVWVKVNDLLDNMAVNSMVQDPVTPNTMYAGTGEGYFNGGAQQGLGVFKSIDGGNTWSALGSTAAFQFVQELAFDNNGKLYASVRSSTASERGIMRSADGGTTWTQVLTSPTSASNRGCDIKVSKDGDIYASLGIFDNGGIYKSPAGVNAGDAGTWTNITPAVAGGAPVAPANEWARIRLAVSPSDNNVMYALLQGGSVSGGTFENACRSIQQYNAGTNTWTVRTVPKIIDQQSMPVNYPLFTRDGGGGQGWYDLSAAVDPNDPNTLVVSGIDICKSTDNGATWNQVSVWVNNSNEQAAGFTNNQEVHADHHNIVYVGGTSSTALFATDGGLYYSTDFNTGTNRPIYNTKNSGLNITQLYATAIHPTAGNNYFLDGCQDNGSHKYTNAGLNNVVQVTGGDGGFCHISPLNPDHQITSYTNNNYYISTNGGVTFPSAVASNGRGSFINPTDYDGNNLYGADSAQSFFRWLDPQSNGATGSKQVVTNFGVASRVTHVSISKQTANRVYFGLNNGRVVRVDNANTLNTGVITGTPRSGSVSCIASRASNEDSMLVSYSNYGGSKIYVTANGTAAGATFVDITGDLPDMPVRWIMFDPRSHRMAIAATELGVWSCDDILAATPQWSITSSGLARVRVDMLKYRSNDRTLLAATHGRGLFSTTIPLNLNPEVNFNVGALTLAEQKSFTTNTCINYTDYPAAIIINGPPSGADATVTIAIAGGTATEGKDYDILVNGVLSKTVVIPDGTTDSKPFTIRVYDDAIVDAAETVNLDFTTSGGGSSIGTANATLVVTINDNDVAIAPPTTPATVTLDGPTTTGNSVYTPFWGNNSSDAKYQTVFLVSELTAAGLVAGSNITELTFTVGLKNSATPFNDFTIKLGHTTSVPTTGSGFLAATNLTTCYNNAAYSTTLGVNLFVFSTPFVWDGTSNLVVQTCFNNTIDWSSFDLVSSKTSPIGAVRTTVVAQSTAADNLEGCTTTPTGSFFISSTRAIIGIKHYKPGTGIETVAGNTKVESLPTATAEYDFLSANNNVIVKIKDPSQDLGCVTATVENDGVGVTTPFASGLRSNKVWAITPTTNGSTAAYTITLYMTTAELNGAIPTTFKVYKTSAGSIAGATAANTVSAPTTVSQNGEFTSFTASFTGFSRFFIGNDAIALPLYYNNFTGVRTNNSNILNWKSSTGSLDRYEVERSLDGVNFSKIGTVNYSTAISDYNLTDNVAYSGAAYYRLKIFTQNGNYYYSYIISLSADKNDRIKIYPSPARTDVIVSVGDRSLINTYISIIDNRGVVVKKVLLTGPQQQVQLSGLPSGIYYFQFANNKVEKVIKE